MRKHDPRVPAEVEDFFVTFLSAQGERAGRLGGGIGGGIGGGVFGSRGGAQGGGRGGARGGARAARRLQTVVSERSGDMAGTVDQRRDRLRTTFPKLDTLRDDPELWRVALPVGFMDLSRVVVDLRLTPAASGPSPATMVRLLAFGKEGLARRGVTSRTGELVWDALSGVDG